MGRVHQIGVGALVWLVLGVCGAFYGPSPARSPAVEELALSTAQPGHAGGGIVVALRSEPKTLNPLMAIDDPSRDVIRCLQADLIHINRETLRTEPALAKSWSVSRDGKEYTLNLRRGLRFSDGQPFTADDVVFSFQVYLDEKTHSPQRDLLVVGGAPIAVRKVDETTVRFFLAQPYAAAERLFDAVAMLPKHLLEAPYRAGKISEIWGVSAAPKDLAGMGPFRLKEYAAGQRVVLEKNPYYWKADQAGTRLPYLQGMTFLFVPTEDAQVIRFQAGETDILSRFSADNFTMLEKQQSAKDYKVYDLGAGLEFNFLFFNLNDLSTKSLPEIAAKQAWFRDVHFRQAISAAIDRQSILHLAYGGRATSLWGQVSPGNKPWVDTALPHPRRSLEHARQLLQSAGFGWKADGSLTDLRGASVEFSILANSSNKQRTSMATLIQSDLREIGIDVHIVPLEFRTMVDRLLNTFNYEAAIMGIVSGDADPTSDMNVWVSSGETHLWDLRGKASTAWEAEMDHLMQKQEVTQNYEARKRLYDRVQEIVAENLPVICLASPNILVAAQNRVRNFRPAILDPYALWNVEELYVR